jgi:hypothetical protein
MVDELFAPTDRHEALSRAYVYAVAAGAGYAVATMDFDRDGVDLEIKAGGGMRPSVALQLKATINLGEATDGMFRFPLKRRNYDLLRIPTQVPRLLIVLDLPTIPKIGSALRRRNSSCGVAPTGLPCRASWNRRTRVASPYRCQDRTGSMWRASGV